MMYTHRMTFHDFSLTLQKLEETPSRLAMTSLLAELFSSLKGAEIRVACYLMQGQLVPAYQSLEFNFSVKMIERTLAKFLTAENDEARNLNLFGESDQFSSNLSKIEKRYKELGDLGKLANEVLSENKADAGFTILKAHQLLVDLATESGEGSQERKLDLAVGILAACDGLSAKFIARMILGKLRLGFSTMTMIDALSWSTTGGKDESAALELAYQKKADLGKLAETYLNASTKEERLKRIADYTVEAGVPVIPALCQRLNSNEEIIEKMGEVYAESKYDGMRIQIHLFKDENQQQMVRAFTRNLEDVTAMFPELDQIKNLFKCESCVVDSEAIGFDPQTGQLVEFQKTITRKRKHDIKETSVNVPIRFYVFDLLELNKESLIDKPLRERKNLLNNLFENNESFLKTNYLITSDALELRSFHEAQLGAGLEGAVMKKADSAYVGGRKGWNWVKIKEEEGSRGKLADTLDVVVMGYYFGRGKRNQFGLGAVLVGVLDQNEEIKTIAKIGTGLSDEQLRQMKSLCELNKVSEQPKNYQIHKGLLPDVFIKPELVIEVAADELTKSPTHSAGVALRFPRMIRFREDKNWEQVTSIVELKQIAKGVV